MNRWFFVLGFTALIQWSSVGGAALLGDSASAIIRRGDVAVLMTVAVHAASGCWLVRTRLRPAADLDPAWAPVQAEKHRRKGLVFAGWGTLVALAWLLVRPSPGAGRDAIAASAWFVVALNWGFQPGMLGAEALAIDARVKLGRRLAGTPPADAEGPDLAPELESELGRI